MIRNMLRIVGVGLIGTVAVASVAHAEGDGNPTSWNAYSCNDSTYGASGSYWSEANDYAPSARSSYDSSCASGNTANTSSAIATATATLRAATTQTVNLITGRIAAVNGNANLAKAVTFSANEKEGQLGLAGGSKNRGLGVWVQGAFTSVEDENTATKFDGNIYTVAGGIDKRLGKAIIGIAGGYENSDIDTTYNSGSIDGKGWFVAPYVSLSINKMINVEATAGMAWIDYDTTRTEATNSEKWAGSTEGERTFGSLAVNATKDVKKMSYTGTLGINYAEEDRDAYNETGSIFGTANAVAATSSKLGQVRFGGTAAYNAGKVQPYLRVMGEWDYTKSDTVAVSSAQTKPTDDDFGVRVGLGLNLNLGPNVKATIEGESVLARDNYTEYSGLAKLRVEF